MFCAFLYRSRSPKVRALASIESPEIRFFLNFGFMKFTRFTYDNSALDCKSVSDD